MSVHTIPVPLGWSPEQAWEAISRGVRLQHPDGEPGWAAIEIEGLTTRKLPSGDELVTGGRLVKVI